MKLRLLVCFVVVLPLFALTATPSSAGSDGFTFSVNAVTPPPGLDTDLNLFHGETVSIIAAGRAHYGFEGAAPCVGTPVTDPNGVRYLNGTTCPPKIDPLAFLPTAPIGKLLAQVGNGPWFSVGTHLEFQPSTGGHLRLLYNDATWSDNSGSYHVDIGIRPTRKDECKDNDFHRFPQHFKNQGQCVSFVNHEMHKN